MSGSTPRRRLLPIISAPHPSGRSAMTCRFRCGDACDHAVPNQSGNEYFGDVVAKALSRRNVLRAGAVGAAAVGFGGLVGSAPAMADPGRGRGRGGGARLRFTPIEPTTADAVVVPEGYQSAVVVRWGDPVLPGAPAFDFDNQTPEAQNAQFGYNCDYVDFFPISDDRALLWVNHEYTNENLMFRGYVDGNEAPIEQIEIGMAAHGGSVVEIARSGRTGRWELVTQGRRRYNRRITAQTPMRFTGPAAGHELLRTAADPEGRNPIGMLNNCAGGNTPWGTILTAEENFNQYFVGGNGVPEADRPALQRYGISTSGDGRAGNRRFDRVEERFDLARHPHEANRFGWIVEIDPFDPTFTPRKHTALGRLKHEGATHALTRDQRVAVYMGDDERFDYVYKYVSRDRFRRGSRRHNSSLLDDGTLYVARFTGDSPEAEIDGTGTLPSDGEFDGTGQWIKLVEGDRSFVEGMSAAEVLIHTRIAADRVGATPMDRPEDVERNPVNGAIYVALTNNSSRTAAQADEANPRAANRYGHIVEIAEHRNDAGAERFNWRIPVVCGNPDDPSTYFSGFDKSRVSPISSPDNLAFDDSGNLWISTDGQPGSIGVNDALHVMPVEGSDRGYLRQFLSVPVGAETCGPFITPDQKTVFVAVQHPGEVDEATPDNPATQFPDGPGGQPRPSVVAAWHTGGGDIGN
ncbi:PhoX family protein [Allonocardiopsis opalescens]|uniref:PhoX family phosphatase n=1 Tax=Allonocardiopsis opalescens TaxID=1144618 RepID=A0A2T0QAL2_9ACTN|nr:PhoX family phosphatase [Allonocardiopsis opalescens]PRY00928.1 hypothetical protein CLV72_102561 [Allonocardiopsis opalescens]